MAGDNDIGGEGSERVDLQRVAWFARSFDNEDTPVVQHSVDFIKFYEVFFGQKRFSKFFDSF